MIVDGKRELLRIPTDRGVAGRRGRLSSAAYRGFLQFLFKAEYAYDMGMPQGIARIDHALSALHLERLFLGRHKVSHFRVWYRDALAAHVREMLLDPRSLGRPYVERKRLEEVVQRHLKGDRNFTDEIHKMLTLELIHRLFLDNSEAGSIKRATWRPDVHTRRLVNHGCEARRRDGSRRWRRGRSSSYEWMRIHVGRISWHWRVIEIIASCHDARRTAADWRAV